MGVCVLMVEQNATEALGISDACVVLAGGRVRLNAPADEVLGMKDLQSLYLGDDARRRRTLMLQTAFNGLVTGVIMTLPALAVTLLFGVLKFPNFAIGAMMTVAAYMAFALNAQLGWPLAAATCVAAIAFGGLCILIDPLTFRPLRGRGGITLMVASLGLGFILENIARFVYGNAARSFAVELARPFRFLDIRMNREQMTTIAVSFARDGRSCICC